MIVSNKFWIHDSEKCVYRKFHNGKGVIIFLYVDDMLIFETDLEVINTTKKFLSSSFDMKDMGEADVIHSMRIKRYNDGLILTQSHYVEKILRKFDHFDSTTVLTSYYPNIKL